MVMTLNAATLVGGHVEGTLLKLSAPISFWGGVDALTGRIADPMHPEHQAVMTGKILAVPRIIGSSSSSQLLLELIYRQKQPIAIILGDADTIIATAALVAKEMGFGKIPILKAPLDGLETGMRLWVSDGRIDVVGETGDD